MFAFLLCPVGPLRHPALPLAWAVRSLCKLRDGRGLFVRVRFDVTGRVACEVVVVLEGGESGRRGGFKKRRKKTEIENTYRAQEQINEADSKQGGFKKERGERAGREKL